jgi:cytoskeletal protein CcmA (bactofilin family)
MDENAKGNLYIGAGVTANGTISAPGLIEVNGTVEGTLTARSLSVADRGVVSGKSTANHIRVAGKLIDTSIAHESLLIESTGLVSGTITYGDLEIRKGGELQGSINSTLVKS